MKTVLARVLLALAVVAVVVPPAAAITPLGFNNPAKQQRYDKLLHELRCLVCQNESLAASNAGLAEDLRREIHAMVKQGKSNARIKQYLVDRYGDFVLYRPPVTMRTYALWFGPAVLLVIGLLALGLTIRRRARAQTAPDLDAGSRARLDALLDKYREEKQ